MENKDFRNLVESYSKIYEETQSEEVIEEGWPFGADTVKPQNSPTGTKSVEVNKPYAARQNNQPVDVTYDNKGEKKVTPMPAGRAGLMNYKYGSTWGMNLNQSYEPEGEMVDEAQQSFPLKKSNEEIEMDSLILSHLLDEGYASSEENALAIMVNMSEEWKESILSEEESDRANDERLMRGGMGAGRGGSRPATSGKKVDPKKHAETSKKAMDLVKQAVLAKYGHGSIM